jgi:hypothetical protein
MVDVQKQDDPVNNQTQPGYYQVDTNKFSGLSIVGFILSFIFPLIGLIISAIAWRKSREEGTKVGLAKAGTIIGAVLFVIGIIANIVLLNQYGPMMNSVA